MVRVIKCVCYIPGSGIPDQVSESIIQFLQVKLVAGPDRPDMESWWLTPFKIEIFCNPKGVCHYKLRPWFCDDCQLAQIATQCAAFGMVSNEHEVCNHKNENKKGLPLPSL